MGLLVPIVTFRKGVLSFSLDVLIGRGLFGYLAYQLSLAIASTDAVSLCSACRRAYIYQSGDQQSIAVTYCPDCREKLGDPLGMRFRGIIASGKNN